MTSSILKHKNQFWLLVAVALAFALRVYALGAQSLWNDEGNSVALAPLSLEAIANAAAHDIHPPLYYFLLHFWLPLVGQTEYAIRFLSVIAGVLTVAVTFRFAYIFFDEEIAIIAAFLSAFSPFQVYYSQEARMYIWVTLWSAVSILAMMVMLKRGTRGEARNAKDESGSSPLGPRNSRTQRTFAWLVYIAATIAALYTQYFAASVVVAENLAFLVWLVLVWRDRRAAIAGRTEGATKQSPKGEEIASPPERSAAQPKEVARNDAIPHTVAFWIAAQAVIGLAIAPWYLSVREQLASWPAVSESLDLPTLLWRVLKVFSVGTTLDAATALPIAIAFGILLFFGLRWTRAAQTAFATSTLVLWLVVPAAVMFAISLSRPAYNPKFLLLATPAFFILAARGLARIYPGLFRRERYAAGKRSSWRWFYFLIGVFVAVGFVPSLRNYYFDSAYARDDYRAILRFINSDAQVGDGILVDDKGQIDVVRYYWRGSQQLFLLPRMRPPDLTATRADVDDMLGKVQHLYAIYYATEQSDPQGIVEMRLAERAFKARDEWHGNVRLAVYGVAPIPRGVLNDASLKVGDELALSGFRMDSPQARAGDILTLTLGWRAVLAPSVRYKVFVHLLDASNQVVAQRDGEPVGDTRPTTTWRAGESLDDNYGVLIAPGTPPGEYTIEIGMYRADNGARLPISRGNQNIGDHLVLGTVVIK